MPGVPTPTDDECYQPNHTQHHDECYVPPTYVAYFEMEQGNDTARKNACENSAGSGGILTAVWLNDYNIPGDGLPFNRPNVCKITASSTSADPTGSASDLYNPPGFVVQ